MTTTAPKPIRSLWQRLFVWGALILSLGLLSQLKFQAPLYDFVAYWSAGRLISQGENPYNTEALLHIQLKEGWFLDQPLRLWNPPWAMPLLIPFGLPGYNASRMFWFLCEVAIIVLAAIQSWKLYQGPPRAAWLGLVCSVIYGPTIVVMLLGQITPFILLGIVGFLTFVQEGPPGDKLKKYRPWLAGAAASLISFKPQLLFLFWIVLALWVIRQRRWEVAIACGGTALAGLGIAMLFNPPILSNYLAATASYPPNYFATPTFGYYLRVWFGLEHFWLQFVPPILGIAWLLLYWRARRAGWEWKQEMPVIMFASILTSSFTWNHDQIILIPAIAQVCTWLLIPPQQIKGGLILAAFLALNVAGIAMRSRYDESTLIWIAPLLLLLYLAARQAPRQARFSS